MQNLAHSEIVIDKWIPLLSQADKELPSVVATVVKEGGTRPAWKHIEDNKETLLMAYPAESLLRASVTLQGEAEGKLQAISVVPLMEGYANKILVIDSHVWKNQTNADVLIYNPTIEKGFWVHNPLYFRDKKDLLPEQPQSMILSGLVLGARKALLDEMTFTKGEAYEKHALQYLAENPDKSRLDVPPLKIDLTGQQIMSLGEKACEYHARAVVSKLDSFDFGPEGAVKKIYTFTINLGTVEQPMTVMLYASESILAKGTVLEEGMDIDLMFWMQGRVVD